MNSDNTPRIDLQALRAARGALDLQILALKRQLRSRWQRPMHDEQRALLRLRQEATELCVLRAWSRGRWHLVDHALCERVAARRAEQFRRAAEVAA